MLMGQTDSIKQILDKNVAEEILGPGNFTHDHTLYNKNIISYSLLDLAFYDLTLYYERLIDNGKYGIKGHVGWNFRRNSYYNSFNKWYYGGISINYYPVCYKSFRYFAGLTLRAGAANYSEVYRSSYTFSARRERINENYLFMKAYIDNGILLSASNHFYCSFVMSIGIQHKHMYVLSPFEPAAMPWFFLGYRF